MLRMLTILLINHLLIINITLINTISIIILITVIPRMLIPTIQFYRISQWTRPIIVYNIHSLLHLFICQFWFIYTFGKLRRCFLNGWKFVALVEFLLRNVKWLVTGFVQLDASDLRVNRLLVRWFDVSNAVDAMVCVFT